MSIIEKLKNPEKPEEDIYIINEKTIHFSEVSFFEAIPSKIENSNRLKEKVKTEKVSIEKTIETLKKQLEDAQKAAGEKAKDAGEKAKDTAKQAKNPISANQINALRGAGKTPEKNSTKEKSANKPQEASKQEQQPKSQENGAESMISQDIAFYEGALQYLPTIDGNIDSNIATMQDILISGQTRSYTIIVDFWILPPPSERQKQNPEKEQPSNKEQPEDDNEDDKDKGGKGKGGKGKDNPENSKDNPENSKDASKSEEGNESEDKDNTPPNGEKARMRDIINGHRKSSPFKPKPIKKDQLTLDVKTLKEKSGHTK